MLRQEQHKHEYTRNPVTRTVRIGNDRVLICYDEYLCNSCGHTLSIITNVKVDQDYYKWI
ncbi:MAG: hypothetical protein KIC98_09615 [Clostridioides difficile]|nr:hypothetical protein [Clostridioides sp.]MBS5788153.1 hypothetical protein [Clostridioides difficile]